MIAVKMRTCNCVLYLEKRFLQLFDLFLGRVQFQVKELVFLLHVFVVVPKTLQLLCVLFKLKIDIRYIASFAKQILRINRVMC